MAEDRELDSSATGGFSLAELAGFDTTDVAIIKSRLPLVGNYVWQLINTKLTMAAGMVGKPPLPRVEYVLGIADFEPAEEIEDFDKSKMIGREMRDSVTLWPSDLEREIGILRGRYQKVGLNSAGPMGGAEGHPKGWLDHANGTLIKGRVRHYTKDGEERAAIDWTGPVELEESAEEVAA